jgi:hypothetical protein
MTLRAEPSRKGSPDPPGGLRDRGGAARLSSAILPFVAVVFSATFPDKRLKY